MTTRRLNAIVFLDVVGYTAMMNRSESATLRLLEQFRSILYPVTEQHGGQVLKELGDGALTRFESALSAVQCAIQIQSAVRLIDGLRLRIGIHIGDVVIEANDVFGEGVNIAARIQPLAPPGGIVVSADVWRQIQNQSAVSVLLLGARPLKGIRAPLDVFAIRAEGVTLPSIQDRYWGRPSVRRAAILGSILLLTVALYFVAPFVTQMETGYVPSIAILQLRNLGSADDDAIAYGITQDLIVDVARAGLIRVAPMNDILSVQKNEPPLREIADRLHVRYVLEGSLKREGPLFRLSAQVIDVPTGVTVWGDRIQVHVRQANELQGRLVEAILGALNLRLPAETRREITRAKTIQPEAYELYLRAKFLYDTKQNKTDVALVRGLFERAVAIDSSFASAHLGVGETYELQGDLRRAEHSYLSALRISLMLHDRLDEANARVKLGIIQWNLGNYPQALSWYAEALALYDSLGDRNGQGKLTSNIGNVYLYQGNLDRALDSYLNSLAIRTALDDKAGQALTLNNVSVAYWLRGNFDKAIESNGQGLRLTRELGDKRNEAMTLNNLGGFWHFCGNYDKALDYFDRSLRLARDLGDKRTESIVLKNQGSTRLTIGALKEARDLFERSLQLAGPLQDKSTLAELSGWYGKLLIEEGRWNPAIDSLKQSVSRFQEIGEQPSLVWFKAWLAFAYVHVGQQDAARRILSEVDSLAPAAEQSENYVEILWTFSQAFQELGDTVGAARFLRRANDVIRQAAAKIQDTGLRKEFLNHQRTNRSVIAAYETSRVKR